METPAVTNAKWWADIWELIEHWAFLGVVLALAIEFAAAHFLKAPRKIIDDARQIEIATLSRDAESERLARVKIEKAIVDELAPRDINKEQIDLIASSLKGRVGTIYLYPLADQEASRYAYAISEALKAGGADVKLMLSNVSGTPVFPDKFNTAVSITGVTAYEFPNGGPDGTVALLLSAFQKAGISIQGQWSEKPLPVFVDGKWSTEVGVQSPAIFVGLKPTPFMQFPAYATPPELEKFLKDHPPPWRSK